MNAIFAVNSVNAFGTGQDMPWPKCSVDLKRFYEITKNSTVIMGSGTWNSNMPKPLPNRRNVVLSKNLQDSKCEIYSNITEMLMNLSIFEPIFVIGGSKVLWALRYITETVYLTRFYDTNPSTITMDIENYLQGFRLDTSTDFVDHKFEIWKRNLI